MTLLEACDLYAEQVFGGGTIGQTLFGFSQGRDLDVPLLLFFAWIAWPIVVVRVETKACASSGLSLRKSAINLAEFF